MKRCTRVPRPSRISSSPVAKGSSVPAWPTRARWPLAARKVRRTTTSTSCDVQPTGLSQSRRPSTHPPSCRAAGCASGFAGLHDDLAVHRRGVQRAYVLDRSGRLRDEAEGLADADAIRGEQRRDAAASADVLIDGVGDVVVIDELHGLSGAYVDDRRMELQAVHAHGGPD